MVTTDTRGLSGSVQLPVAPIETENFNKWFEVALCEQGEMGQVIVKDVKKSFVPEFIFHDGLDPEKFYALAIRRVEVRDGVVRTGDWSGLTEWRKPNVARDDG